MSCMNCSEDDVVVLISHTGRTKSQVELAQLARENDAMRTPVWGQKGEGGPSDAHMVVTFTVSVKMSARCGAAA